MVKACSSTAELPSILRLLSTAEGDGIHGVAVKCVDIIRTPVAKAVSWSVTDTEARKRGEQTGLDTLVVHALNDEYSVLGRKVQCQS